MADEFDTDKGVKDDYIGTILEAYFQAGDNGDTSLVLKKLAEDGDEVEDRYRCGNEWASFDGGETIEHATKQKINASSQLALLVEKAMACGAEAAIRERSGGMGQRTAKLWPQLKFHWSVVSSPYSFKDRETGEPISGTSYKSYPDEYLGIDESTGESPGVDKSDEAPAEVIAKLSVLAKTKTYSEWVDAALLIDYVRDNMVTALSNESFYTQLKES